MQQLNSLTAIAYTPCQALLIMVYIKPNSNDIRNLIKKIKKGDENACDELFDIIDDVANLNIILIDKIKKISNICNNA